MEAHTKIINTHAGSKLSILTWGVAREIPVKNKP